MHRRRLYIIALAVASVGCRAGSGSGGLNPSPSLGGPKTVDQRFAADVVDQINANALKIQTLKAKPEVSVSGKMLGGGAVHGLMAVQTPRDFRLQLEALGNRQVADLGSNPDGFWFWTQNKESRQYPVGRYDEDGNPPADVPLTLQPDFIVEALGLREIAAADAAKMKVTRLDATRLKLTESRKSAKGDVYSKVLIVDEATKQVVERQLLDANQRLIASAKVIGPYQSIRLPRTEGEVTADTASLPRKLKLDLVEMNLTLNVDLKDVTLNESLDPKLFKEPDKRAEGYTRVEVGGSRPAVASGPKVRQTRPAPPVRLGDPVGIPDDDLPRLPNGVVGPREPSAPSSLSPSSAVRAASFEGN